MFKVIWVTDRSIETEEDINDIENYLTDQATKRIKQACVIHLLPWKLLKEDRPPSWTDRDICQAMN
jgi:hypothetical protein